MVQRCDCWQVSWVDRGQIRDIEDKLEKIDIPFTDKVPGSSNHTKECKCLTGIFSASGSVCNVRHGWIMPMSLVCLPSLGALDGVATSEHGWHSGSVVVVVVAVWIGIEYKMLWQWGIKLKKKRDHVWSQWSQRPETEIGLEKEGGL